MAGVSFVSTALMGTNKVGSLKPNKDGYYSAVMGGFETSNVHGDFYSFEKQTQDLFEDSSQLQRQIKAGNLFGEYGHPARKPGESINDFIRRCLIVSEDRQAFHIRALTLNFKDVKDAKDKPIVAVIGEIKPLGPYGGYLRDILDTPSANCCFSVRAQTTDSVMANGRERRSTKQIITYDYVIDPGVITSTKYNSPKLEDAFDQYVDYSVLAKIRGEMGKGELKLESAASMAKVDELLRDYRADLNGGTRMPRSRNW